MNAGTLTQTISLPIQATVTYRVVPQESTTDQVAHFLIDVDNIEFAIVVGGADDAD